MPLPDKVQAIKDEGLLTTRNETRKTDWLLQGYVEKHTRCFTSRVWYDFQNKSHGAGMRDAINYLRK